APAAVAAAARVLAGGPPRTREIASADVRLLSAPIFHGGRRVGTVVAGVSLVPYEETRRSALIATLALGGAIALLVLAAAWWLLVSSLRPVARMTRQADAWSERDLGRRFALGEPHDELTELAATLDGLLERLSTSLSREQRFSAEISHELRTPLSRVLAETELALRRERTAPEYREALSVVRRNAEQLAQIVDALVAAARHEAGASRGTANAYDVARASVEACAAFAAEQGVHIELVQTSVPIRLGVERELAERILQPILENACRYGESSVSVALARENGGVVVFEVVDDGPGVSHAEAERIFEPGGRGAAGSHNGHDGAGLGLALARRLARSASGDVEAASGSGGLFRVRLPSA
ncbi:MAG TPA: HAMP domain-containing sensor histidine kinase, partial [Gaiellaceae bacterium]|nr:HAMP domain-containing sensor histidine kinase [Gaiellaceae bacterium]